MSDKTLLAQLAERDRKKRDAAHDAFRALALTLAKGEAGPSADEADAILTADGKTPAHLAAKVEETKVRLKLRAAADDGENAAGGIPAARDALQAELDAFAEVEEAHKAKRLDLERQLRGLTHRRDMGEKARQELIRTSDPSLVGRRDEAVARREEARNNLMRVQAEVKKLERNAQLPDIPPEKPVTMVSDGRTVTGPHPSRLHAEKSLPAARARLDVAELEMAEASADVKHLEDLLGQV